MPGDGQKSSQDILGQLFVPFTAGCIAGMVLTLPTATKQPRTGSFRMLHLHGAWNCVYGM